MALVMLVACGKDEPKVDKIEEHSNDKIEKAEPNKNDPKKEDGTEENKPNKSVEEEKPQKPATDVKKPEDYHLRQNLHAEWLKPVEESDFAYDKLYEEGDKAIFTADYLARYIRFVSSDHTTPRYELTSKDIKDLSVSDIKVQQGGVAIKMKYKGLDKAAYINLPFDRLKYYDSKVTIKTDSPKANWYVGGVAHIPSLYLSELLDYDTERYAHDEIKAVADYRNNSLELSFKLVHQRSERDLVTISKTIKGFKSVQKLAQDLVIASGYELNQSFGKRFYNEQDMAKVKQALDNPQLLLQYLEKAQIMANGEELSLAKKSDTSNGSQEYYILESEGQGREHYHYYFVSPRFELVSVRREGQRLYLSLALVAVGDYVFDRAIPLKQEMMITLHKPTNS